MRSYLFLFLLPILVKSKEESIVRGHLKLTMHSLVTSSDQDAVEYFEPVPGTERLYRFKVVKLTSRFLIKMNVKTLRTQRSIYNMENFEGCAFVNNPLANQIFGGIYRNLVVNNSYFRCPIKPGIYFLKNVITPNLLPALHPPGKFQLLVGLSKPEYREPYIMKMLWNYSITYLK